MQMWLQIRSVTEKLMRASVNERWQFTNLDMCEHRHMHGCGAEEH